VYAGSAYCKVRACSSSRAAPAGDLESIIQYDVPRSALSDIRLQHTASARRENHAMDTNVNDMTGDAVRCNEQTQRTQAQAISVEIVPNAVQTFDGSNTKTLRAAKTHSKNKRFSDSSSSRPNIELILK